MSKNTAVAIRHRQMGNKLFAKSRFCEALLSYNHSLCYSEENSEDAALAFANRSAVYKELCEYELCMANIELAKASGYPRDKIEKLNIRELECKQLMKSHEKDPDDDPALSSRLPCLVDCLKLKSNQHGTYIVTNQDLKAGDIIASTESAFHFPLTRARLHVCSYCTRSMKLNLIPCSRCARAMYCSNECLKADAKEFHKIQCSGDVNPIMASLLSDVNLNALKMLLHVLAQFDGDVTEMRKFFEENQTPKTVFDFDLSDKNDPMYKKKMLLAMISSKKIVFEDGEFKKAMLEATRIVIENNRWLKSMWNSKENKKFLDSFLLKLMDASAVKTFVSVFCKTKLNLEESLPIDEKSMPKESNGWVMNHSAVRLDPFYSMITHSCFPNVLSKFVDNKSFWIVIRPIKAGETISRTLLSGPIFNEKKKKRQSSIKFCTGKRCTCEGCVNNWPLPENMPNFIQVANMDKMIYGVSNDYLFIKNEHKRDYAMYTMMINSMEDYFPCKEMATCILQLLNTLYPLALPAPWFNIGN